MLVNLLPSCVLLMNSLTLLFFMNFFLMKNSPYSDVLDFYSRVHLNEDYFSMFYFFWTSFWYLPSAYLALIVISYYFLFVKFLHKLGILAIAVFSVVNFVELLDYPFLNLSSTYLIMSSDLVNNLLTNSINKYHPLIFYVSTIHLFKSFFTAAKSKSWPKSEPLTIISTLALGSWWASQEGSWGGWWNWDPSEVFGLLIMLSILLVSHQSLRSLKTYMSTFSRVSVSLVIFLAYFFIQLNFDIVSHNFGTKISAYVSSVNFLVVISLQILFLNVKIYKKVDSNFTSNLILFPRLFSGGATSVWPSTRRTGNLLPRIYVSIAVVTLVTASFSLLVNDFLWKFLTISVVNYFIDYSVLVHLLTLIILFIIWDLHSTAIPTFIALYIYQPYSLLVLPLIRLRPTKSLSLHLVILLSFIVNIALVSKTLTCWAPLWESFTVCAANTASHQNIALNLNQLNIGVTSKNLLFSFLIEYPYGFISSSSSNEIHTFAHVLTLNKLIQELFVGNTLTKCSIRVLNFDLSSVNMLFMISITKLYLILYSKKVIVF